MNQITLERTGDRPVRFRGEKIAEVSTWTYQGPGQNRWHEIVLYSTTNGRYVLSITYHTQWQGEHDHYQAVICPDTNAVAAELQTYDPNRWVKGFPTTTVALRDREHGRALEMQERWDVAVSEILADMPEEI